MAPTRARSDHAAVAERPDRSATAPAQPFCVNLKRSGSGVFVARVDGDIDKASAPKLSTSLHLLLERPDCEVLIADLSGVSSMSEEGLRILEQVVGRRVVDRNGGSADCRPAHAYGPAWRVERPPEGRAGPGGRRIRTQIRAAVTSP